MAEETDLSRTEPASPRRLQQARSAGDVPRSAELTAWVVLLAALGMLGWQAPRLMSALQALTETALVDSARPLSPAFFEAAQSALWTVLPVLAAIFAAALVAPMLLSGWVFAPQFTQPDLTRAHPFKPLARLSSADSLFDGSLALLKLALAGAAAGWALAAGWPGLQGLAEGGTGAALDAAAAWRWWRYLRRHAMTWQEVLAEAREAEGSPEMRAQLRSRQQQAGQGPLPLAGEGANAGPKTSPLPNPLPRAGEGANAKPTSIDEVIG